MYSVLVKRNIFTFKEKECIQFRIEEFIYNYEKECIQFKGKVMYSLLKKINVFSFKENVLSSFKKNYYIQFKGT